MGDVTKEDVQRAIERFAEGVALLRVSTEVIDEVTRARKRHGKQADMDFGTGATQSYLNELWHEQPRNTPLHILDNEDAAELAKTLEKSTSHAKVPTWANVLGEEFFEAIAEDEWPKLRAELVQVAAMAVSWITIGDERERGS